MEHNRPRIIDCNYYEQGYYAAFYDNGGTLLMCDNWVKCKEIRRIIAELLRINSAFAVQTERDKVGGIISEFTSFDVPFAVNKRFDMNNAYYRINTSAFPGYLTQITAAAAYKDRNYEKENKLNPTKPDVVQPSWSFDDASTAFSKGLRGLMELINGKSAAYDTYKFEQEFNMVWCCGPEKCPEPKPCMTCPVPSNPGAPGQPKPGKPNKPGNGDNNGKEDKSTVAWLKKSMVTNGLKVDRFFLDTLKLGELDCEADTKTRVKDLSDGLKLAGDRVILYSEVDLEECTVEGPMELWTYYPKVGLLENETYVRSPDTSYRTGAALVQAMNKIGLDRRKFHVHKDNYDAAFCDSNDKDTDVMKVEDMPADMQLPAGKVLLYSDSFTKHCDEREEVRMWTYNTNTGDLYKELYKLTKR